MGFNSGFKGLIFAVKIIILNFNFLVQINFPEKSLNL